jgi:glycosyltransferase involved in cell wall biosynthesis
MSLVSILLCCYNDGAYVERALESAYAQTGPADQREVVFVNDGSTDATHEIATAWTARPGFRYFRHDRNLGLPAACNRGLQEARGDYLIRLDADDLFDPRLLSELTPPMDRDEADLVYSDRVEVWPAEGRSQTIRLDPFRVDALIAVGVLMRRRLLLELGGWRDLFWEEYDLYLRYLGLSVKPPRRIAQPLVTYIKRAGSMTADGERVQRGWEQLMRAWPPEVLERFGCSPPMAPTMRRP